LNYRKSESSGHSRPRDADYHFSAYSEFTENSKYSSLYNLPEGDILVFSLAISSYGYSST